MERMLAPILRETLSSQNKSVLLLGPRQVGKSTLAKALNPSLALDLAREAVFRAHGKDPELIERQVRALEPGALVLVDEVQRLPELLNSVQALIDQKTGVSFLLTGSSARKLRREGTNLLPGRVFSHRLFPLTYWELGDAFDLDKCLSKGCLPEVYLEDYGSALLRDYIDIYLREEILAEGLVRRAASFGGLLDVIAKVAGHELNYAALASDSEIPKESLRRYIDILEDTLIVHRLPGFRGTPSRKAVQREKLLVFDVGVRNGILGIQDNVFIDEEKGALFEQWFIMQLMAYAAYGKRHWQLHYYRDDHKNEVDLVIESRTAVVAIEVKWGARYKHEWSKGLTGFSRAATKKVTSFVVYRGETKQKDGDITVVPYRTFLDDIETFLAPLAAS